jgi:hypothetical protein
MAKPIRTRVNDAVVRDPTWSRSPKTGQPILKTTPYKVPKQPPRKNPHIKGIDVKVSPDQKRDKLGRFA